MNNQDLGAIRAAIEAISEQQGAASLTPPQLAEALQSFSDIPTEFIGYLETVDPFDLVELDESLIVEYQQSVPEPEAPAAEAPAAEAPAAEAPAAEAPAAEAPAAEAPIQNTAFGNDGSSLEHYYDIPDSQPPFDSYMEFESTAPESFDQEFIPSEVDSGLEASRDSAMPHASVEMAEVKQIDLNDELREKKVMEEERIQRLSDQIDQIVEGTASTEPENIKHDREIAKVMLDIKNMYLTKGASEISASALEAIIQQHNTPPNHPLKIYSDYRVDTAKNPSESMIPIATLVKYDRAYANEAANWWAERKIQEGRQEQRERDENNGITRGTGGSADGGDPNADDELEKRRREQEKANELAASAHGAAVPMGPAGAREASSFVAQAVSMGFGATWGLVKGVGAGLGHIGADGYVLAKNGLKSAQNASAFALANNDLASDPESSEKAVELVQSNQDNVVKLTNSSQSAQVRNIQAISKNVDAAEKAYAEVMKARVNKADPEPYLIKAREALTKANTGLHKLDPASLKAMPMPAKDSLSRVNKRLSELDKAVTQDMKKVPAGEKTPNMEKLQEKIKDLVEMITKMIKALFRGRSVDNNPGLGR